MREEAALASQFFALERVRLGERLELVLNIAPDCADTLVPALILPPLAQFAMAHRHVPGTVHVAIRRHGAALRIDVYADGGDAVAKHDDLAPVAARLHRLYGEHGTVQRHADGRVHVELPARRVEAAATMSAAA